MTTPDSFYLVHGLSHVVHHRLCTQTKRSPLLAPWTQRLPGDRACRVCLPDGLPQEVTA